MLVPPLESFTCTYSVPAVPEATYTPVAAFTEPRPDAMEYLYGGEPPEAVNVRLPLAGTVAEAGEIATGATLTFSPSAV